MVERFPIKGYLALSSLSVIIRQYPALSGIICYYPALSGNRYSKKQYLCTRNRAGTLGDKQNVQAVSHGPRHSFSVPPPFIIRSISVLPSFFLRFFSVFERKITENKRKTNGKQTESKRLRSEKEANKQRTCSELAANLRRNAARVEQTITLFINF